MSFKTGRPLYLRPKFRPTQFGVPAMAQPVKSKTMAAPANAVGFSWPGVITAANHVVHLLETQGATALDVVKCVMLGIAAATSRDLTEVYKQLNAATLDVQALIAAVKTEFGI